jgi:hypothetical protein
MSRHPINLGLILLLVGLWGCGTEAPTTQAPPIPKPQEDSFAKEPQVLQEDEEIPIYVYEGDRFRDPFMPVGQVTSYQPDAVFDPQRAEVTAIIFGRSYRSAVLRIGGAGSYFVKSGKIFDIMGKTIDNYRARVLVDRVIITGEAEEIFELKIRQTEEDQT